MFRYYDKISPKFNLQGGKVYSFVHCLGYFSPVSWLNSLYGANFMVGNMWAQSLLSQRERVEAGPGSHCSLQGDMMISLPSTRTHLQRLLPPLKAPSLVPDLQPRVWRTSVMQKVSYPDVDLLWSSNSASRLGFHRDPQDYFEVKESMVGRGAGTKLVVSWEIEARKCFSMCTVNQEDFMMQTL